MTVAELYRALDSRIPRNYACSWDNDGLSCCPDPDAPVTGILLALDLTENMPEAAHQRGFNVILTHHPLLFRPLKSVSGGNTGSRKVITMIQNGISAMAFHTRLDALPGGVNDTLAAALGLADITPFGDADGATRQACPSGALAVCRTLSPSTPSARGSDPPCGCPPFWRLTAADRSAASPCWAAPERMTCPPPLPQARMCLSPER